MKKWLVCVKPKLQYPQKFEMYYEVEANWELSAAMKGFDLFENDFKYIPLIKKKMDRSGLTPKDLYAEAVEI